MTPESRFLLIAAIAIAYFVSELLLRNAVGEYTREWRSSSEGFGTFLVFDRFVQTLNLATGAWTILSIILLLSLCVLLVGFEIAPELPVAAVLAAIAFFLASQRLIEGFCEWQAKRFEERLVDAIDVMASALVAGASPLKAFEAAARWTEGRTSREFQEILRRLELGFTIEQSLDRIVRVYDSEGVRLFAQAVRAKWHIGGDLADILTATNRIVRERIRMRLQAAGQLSGVRNASLFVACMPHVLYTLLFIIQPEWISAIHADPLGAKLIYVALAAQILGFLWLSRALRFEG